MSLIQILLQPDKAFVAMDTLTDSHLPGASAPHWHESSKMIPLVAPNAILATRGDGAFLSRIFSHCSTAQRTLEFDSLCDELDAHMMGLNLGYEAHQFRRGLAATIAAGNEFHLVGWSERRSAMACLSGHAIGSSVSKNFRENGVIGPALSGALDSRTMFNDSEFLRRARQQVEVASAEDPAMPIGGRLLLAELTRTTLSIRDLGEI